ncbi:hypothetical protein LP420_31080 [Massilia sp. B-10]|nr:hypothetical protein LP420_31080 [Massilia sp. B-10]
MNTLRTESGRLTRRHPLAVAALLALLAAAAVADAAPAKTAKPSLNRSRPTAARKSGPP